MTRIGKNNRNRMQCQVYLELTCFSSDWPFYSTFSVGFCPNWNKSTHFSKSTQRRKGGPNRNSYKYVDRTALPCLGVTNQVSFSQNKGGKETKQKVSLSKKSLLSYCEWSILSWLMILPRYSKLTFIFWKINVIFHQSFNDLEPKLV